jgi:hypothetical protein
MASRRYSDYFPFSPILAGGMAGAFGLWWLACAIGTSFASGAQAVVCSAMVLVLIGAAQSVKGVSASTTGYAALVLLWPCWWPVTTSIALHQVDPATGVVPLHAVHTWYTGVWLKALVEVGLLVLLAWTVTRARRTSWKFVLHDNPTESESLPTSVAPNYDGGDK